MMDETRQRYGGDLGRTAKMVVAAMIVTMLPLKAAIDIYRGVPSDVMFENLVFGLVIIAAFASIWDVYQKDKAKEQSD